MPRARRRVRNCRAASPAPGRGGIVASGARPATPCPGRRAARCAAAAAIPCVHPLVAAAVRTARRRPRVDRPSHSLPLAPCQPINSTRNPPRGRRSSPSRRASWSSATPPASTSTAGSGAPTSTAAWRTPACSPRRAILSADDRAAIERGLAQIAAEIEAGSFEWKLELEDVHLNIEARLTQLVGDAGKRLHTGRSRNDQVATDVRLWLRGEIDAIVALLRDLQRALVELAERNVEVDPARLHPPAGGAAGELRPPPAGLRRDVRPRRRAPGRRAPARQPAAARRRRARRHQLPARPRARRAHARLRRRLPEQPRRGQRPRLRDRVRGGRLAVHGARLAPGRGAGAVDEPELRLHRPRRPLLHRLVDHAAEEEPRRARAGARQDRPRRRPPDGAAHADEGPAAGLQQGQPGGQGAALRHRRHARGHAAHLLRDGRRHQRQARGDGARRAARATPPRPTSPTTW